MLDSCLSSNKFIGVCVRTENVACGSDMSKNLHSLVGHCLGYFDALQLF